MRAREGAPPARLRRGFRRNGSFPTGPQESQMYNFLSALIICGALVIIGEFVSRLTKTWLPSVFVTAVLILIGYWTVLPKTLVTDAYLLPLGATVSIFMIVTHMGTMISIEELLAQWKTVDLAALAQPARFGQGSAGNASNATSLGLNGSKLGSGANAGSGANGGSEEKGAAGNGQKGMGGSAGGSRVISFKEIQRQQQEEKARQKQKQKAETQKGWGSVLRQNVVPVSLIARETKEEAKQAKQAKQTMQTKQPSELREPVRSSNFLDGAKQKAGIAETRRMEGEGNSDAFDEWCKDQMMELYGSDDISLLEFCRDLDDSQILLYLQDLLGTSKRVTAFGKEFIRRKHL